MIKNERQYAINKAQISKFERGIDQLKNRPSPDDPADPRMREIQAAALQSLLDALHADCNEYGALRAGQITRLPLSSVDELPAALIKARIAAGLTHRELADRLGLKEQQIQRYEATDYESASLARISEIASALGFDLKGTVELPGSPPRAA